MKARAMQPLATAASDVAGRRRAVAVAAAAGRVVDALGRLLGAMSEMLVALLALLFACEVVMRYGFNRPSGFADQLGAVMMPAIAFLALARTWRDGQHVQVDLVVQRLPLRLARPLGWCTELLTLGVAALLTWYTGRLAWLSLVDEERLMVGIWNIPLFLPQVVLPLGLAVLTLQLLLSLASVRTGPAAAPKEDPPWSP